MLDHLYCQRTIESPYLPRRRWIFRLTVAGPARSPPRSPCAGCIIPGIRARFSTGDDSRHNAFDQFRLEVLRILIATSETDKHQIQTGHDVAMVVAEAGRLNEVVGTALV